MVCTFLKTRQTTLKWLHFLFISCILIKLVSSKVMLGSLGRSNNTPLSCPAFKINEGTLARAAEIASFTVKSQVGGSSLV